MAIPYMISTPLLLCIFIIFSSYSFFIVLVNAVFNPVTKPIISFCAGGSHTCIVFDNYKMKCMGNLNSIGSSINYGDKPSTVGNNIPYFNPGTSLNITQVTCSYVGMCMLLNTGGIKCLGDNRYGQTGLGLSTHDIVGSVSGHVGDTLPFVNLRSGLTVSSVVSGNSHTCVFTTEKRVICFGKNNVGQLGLGDMANRGKLSTSMGENLTSLDFGVNVTVASIHSGVTADHNCAILSAPAAFAQRLKCWGLNNQYQLGYGDINSRGDNLGEMGDNLPAIDLGTESRVKQISLGAYHTCAVLINDGLKCWGSGITAQMINQVLGAVKGNSAVIPSVLIDSGKTIQFLVSGQEHNCIAYDDSLSMKCWGSNAFGQLGQVDQYLRGRTQLTVIPLIPAIQLGTSSLKILSIHSGAHHNCVVFIDYSVKCFGKNSDGELGVGSNANVGDNANEMGNNLHFAELFSPSNASTKPQIRTSNSPSKYNHQLGLAVGLPIGLLVSAFLVIYIFKER